MFCPWAVCFLCASLVAFQFSQLTFTSFLLLAIFSFLPFRASIHKPAFLPILNFSLINKTWNTALCKCFIQNILSLSDLGCLNPVTEKAKLTFFSYWDLNLLPVYLPETSYVTAFPPFLVMLQVQGIVIGFY